MLIGCIENLLELLRWKRIIGFSFCLFLFRHIFSAPSSNLTAVFNDPDPNYEKLKNNKKKGGI